MASNADFGERTGATEVAGAFPSQIKGKVILIVGVSPNSLGESKAAALASQSPSLLILASRTLEKIKEVSNKLDCPTAAIQVDLACYTSVRAAAQKIANLTPRIDILINNAAIVHPSHILTPDHRHEIQFATTFLGPFLLTNLLLPQLLASALSPTTTPLSTRIINVTSAGHRISPIRFSDPHFHLPLSSLPDSERPAASTPKFFLPRTPEDTYAPFLAYGQAKSANILFSVALNRRLAGLHGTAGRAAGIASFGVHPGSIWTELSRNLDDELQKVIKGTGAHWKDLDAGSATALVAALDPGLVEPGTAVKGVYLSDCQVDGTAVEHAIDGEVAERLWALAEREVGETFDVYGLVRSVLGENAGKDWAGTAMASRETVLQGRGAVRETKV